MRGRPSASYESKLNADREWALREGSMHFDERSAVHKSLKAIAKRLNELQIPYAVADGMALFSHGLRRFTEDVDILASSQGLHPCNSNMVVSTGNSFKIVGGWRLLFGNAG
jgi:hypothetical protein